MINFDHSILKCPIKNEHLIHLEIPSDHFKELNIAIDEKISEGFVNESRSFFYPVIDGIILLLPHYSIPIGENSGASNMSFDKDRVFRYYNEISYIEKEGNNIYEDSGKWVDFRNVSKDYIENSFSRVREFIPHSGKYFLDIASGPIGLKEYLALSIGYEYRICVDISFNALVQAKKNYSEAKGIYICGDITNVPLQDNVIDTVVSQHTLYHVPKSQQKQAVEELYRVAIERGLIAIVYNWFYYSWMMNLFLFPIQIYRILRYWASMIYTRFFSKKPRLYFYVHPPSFFEKLAFGDKVEIFCWRSTNKYFLNLYIHKFLGGKRILKWLQGIEKKYSKFMGIFGEYPLIIIRK